MSVKVTVRFPDDVYEKIMAYEGKDFTSKLIFILSDKDSNDNEITEVSDNINKVSDSTEYISRINYLQHLLNDRVSLFNEKYTLGDLGFFLFEANFLEKFRKGFANEWGESNSFTALYDRLKIVYSEAYSNGQQNEKDLYGHVTTMMDEFRAIKL